MKKLVLASNNAKKIKELNALLAPLGFDVSWHELQGNALLQAMRENGVAGQKLGVDFIDINMLQAFQEAKLKWVDGMTPMMETVWPSRRMVRPRMSRSPPKRCTR
mgnify:CR=1 FL=1